MNVEVWVDGSANNNAPDGWPGGWGVVLLTDKGHRKELSGVVQHPEARPTNNDMELQAMIEGLRAIKKPELLDSVTAYTDSQVTIARCHKRAWRTPDPVILLDTVHEEIRRIRRHCPLVFRHVPGHDGVEHNERAHELAFEQYEKHKPGNAGVTEEDGGFSIRLAKQKMLLDRLADEADRLLPKLDEKAWGKEAIENVRRFQKPAARFYPFVSYKVTMDTPCKVRANGKLAWLLRVTDNECFVTYRQERKWNSRKKGDDKWEYGQAYPVPHHEVTPLLQEVKV